MGNITKKSDNYITYGCTYCLVSNIGRLVQLFENDIENLGVECINCGTTKIVTMTTEDGIPSKDPQDYNFGNVPRNTDIDMIKSENFRTFPLSTDLSTKYSIIKWVIFSIVMIFVGRLLQLLGIGGLIEFYFITLFGIAILSKSIDSMKIHKIVTKRNMLPKSETNKLREYRIRSYSNQIIPQIVNVTNPLFQILGIGFLGFAMIFVYDPNSISLGTQIFITLIFTISGGYLLGKNLKVEQIDQYLPDYAIPNLKQALQERPDLNFSSNPKYSNQQQGKSHVNRSNQSSSMRSIYSDSQPTLATSSNYPTMERDQSAPKNEPAYSSTTSNYGSKKGNKCNNCDDINPDNASFCQVCGDPLE